MLHIFECFILWPLIAGHYLSISFIFIKVTYKLFEYHQISLFYAEIHELWIHILLDKYRHVFIVKYWFLFLYSSCFCLMMFLWRGRLIHLWILRSWEEIYQSVILCILNVILFSSINRNGASYEDKWCFMNCHCRCSRLFRWTLVYNICFIQKQQSIHLIQLRWLYNEITHVH